MKAENRILTIDELIVQSSNWRRHGETIVFTNGVFDILHLGHVNYLADASALGTKLVVGINSDSSVRRLGKGPERPINPEQARAGVIAGLRSVEAAVVFNEDTPLHLILALKPSVLVKGGDYDPNEQDPNSKRFMVGSTEVRNWGGKAVSIPLTEGFSTTNVVTKIAGKPQP